MRSVAVGPAVALLAGAVGGIVTGLPGGALRDALPPLLAAAWASWAASDLLGRRRGAGHRRWSTACTFTLVLFAFGVCGVVLAADATERALHTTLRALLDEEHGGFVIDTLGPEGDHEPVMVRARLVEDAAPRDGFVTVRLQVREARIGGRWRAAAGGLTANVGGTLAAERAGRWRAGRVIEAPMTFSRPSRYLNAGVRDFERDLALDGTTLFASAKSGLLVQVVQQGSRADEFAAAAREHVRRAVALHVGVHSPLSGAIVTAVLIGDRTGLPDTIRDRLQAAGTYHVIAISGGNIAILAALVLLLLMACGIRGRPAAAIAIVVLGAYASIVTTGPSVWRATVMAVVYLAARVADHRTPPWHATAVAAAVMVMVQPLDIRDAGFILTFGTTAALLEGARRARRALPAHRALAWLAASLTASLAAEVALLPVAAQTFSRVTTAGLVLNLVAVPAMALVQVAGLLVSFFDGIDAVAAPAGSAAHAGALVLVESARLVEVAPWLAARVPAPGLPLIGVYYGGLAGLLLARRRMARISAGVLAAGAAALIVSGADPVRPSRVTPSAQDELRLTLFDVGQGDALLLEAPGGASLMIDAGGAPFGSGGFDIGRRVLAPALWARGLRRLDTLAVTHGDPDHLGGAPALVDDFRPSRVWEGIRVPSHEPSAALFAAAAARGATVEPRRAGESFALGGARIRVLHPPPPDWERPRVRNDDSLVLEVRYRDVALLLTGDISADVERAIVPQLTAAPIRILKVAHHGSAMEMRVNA